MNDINHPTYIELYLNHSLNQNQISKKSPIYNMAYLHFYSFNLLIYNSLCYFKIFILAFLNILPFKIFDGFLDQFCFSNSPRPYINTDSCRFDENTRFKILSSFSLPTNISHPFLVIYFSLIFI